MVNGPRCLARGWILGRVNFGTCLDVLFLSFPCSAQRSLLHPSISIVTTSIKFLSQSKPYPQHIRVKLENSCVLYFMASVHPSSSSSLPTRTHLSSPSASTLSTHSISIKSILDPNPFSIQSWWNSFSVPISQNIESQSNPFSIQSNPDPFSIQSSANPSKPVSIKSTKTQFQFISFKLSTLIQFIIDANLNFKPKSISIYRSPNLVLNYIFTTV